jgi:hypothetical protein
MFNFFLKEGQKAISHSLPARSYARQQVPVEVRLTYGTFFMFIKSNSRTRDGGTP